MLYCPFCASHDLRVATPIKHDSGVVEPAYKCWTCNVRIVVTNKSYLPKEELARYCRIVTEKKIGKQ